MTILSILATIFGTIMAFANIPQSYKIFKRKSAKDISILTYLIFFIGTVIWALYGLEIKNFPLIIANSFGVLFIGIVIIGWFLYGREKK
jgi:MtN3 and saliva related transmembrane protein